MALPNCPDSTPTPIIPQVGKIYTQVGYPNGAKFLVISVDSALKLATIITLNSIYYNTLEQVQASKNSFTAQMASFGFFLAEVKPKATKGAIYQLNGYSKCLGIGLEDGRVQMFRDSVGVAYPTSGWHEAPRHDFDPKEWKVVG